MLGDGLALAAACARAAIRWHGRPADDFEALLGRFGLAAALAPVPEADPAAPARHPHVLCRLATLTMVIPATPAARIPPP